MPVTTTPSQAARIYAATFSIAFASLVIEIALTRLLSVITYYGLAYLAISTAMLGMTAGAVTVYLRPSRFSPEKLAQSLARSCFECAVSTPVAIALICTVPLDVDFSILWRRDFVAYFPTMKVLCLLIVTGACALPFYFSGIVVSAVLTKVELPITRLYASDLLGAAFGCVLVLFGLELFDAQSLVILAGAPAVAAAFLFGWNDLGTRSKKLGAALLVVLIAVSLVNHFTLNGIRPIMVKGRVEDVQEVLLEKWTASSRVTVNKQGVGGGPRLWGPSPVTPHERPSKQHFMVIDGEAGTVMREFAKPADIDHLRYDVTNTAYYLRQGGSACIIGVGGGKDVQSAILFGHKRVVGIDINHIFIDLLEGRFREFAGIANHPGVSLKVDEARSYLSRSRERFDIIQMSLIDTWAATAAGAYSLSENSLYTVEAWRTFLSRLKDDGVFTLSRWYNQDDLGETGRVVSLATATLLDLGVPNPSKHIAMVTARAVATVIIAKKAFSERDTAILKRAADDLQFGLAMSPGELPQNEILRKIVTSKSKKKLSANVASEALNYEPPTDEQPYFFNMLSFGSLFDFEPNAAGVLLGNLTASLTLVILILCLFALTVTTVVIPLLFGSRGPGRREANRPAFAAAAFYFSSIGFGFMFVEMALVQRLSVYLGHPVYALGVLLFTMILSTGFGSLVSSRLPLTRKPWLYLAPLIAAAAIIVVERASSLVVSGTITWGTAAKIAVAVSMIFPMGMVLGVFFPTGMSLVRDGLGDETPWYWALNGICGVLGSAAAVFISIYVGISVNFYLAAALYGLLTVALFVLGGTCDIARSTSGESSGSAAATLST